MICITTLGRLAVFITPLVNHLTVTFTSGIFSVYGKRYIFQQGNLDLTHEGLSNEDDKKKEAKPI